MRPTLAVLATLLLSQLAHAAPPLPPEEKGSAVYSITDFGAKPDPNLDSTEAFEKAIAAARSGVLKRRGVFPRPTAIVKVPSARDAYSVSRPIFVPDSVDVIGDGDSSAIVGSKFARQPIFVVGVDDPAPVDADRPDLFGILDSSAAPRRGARRGFSTSNGKFLQLQHFDLSLGRWGIWNGEERYEYWEMTDQLTIELGLVRDPAKPWKLAQPVCGLGDSCEVGRPRPWVLQTHAENPGWLTLYISDNTVSDELDRANIGITFAVPNTRVLRLTFQINLRDGRFATWANGVQLSVNGADQIKPGRRFRFNDDWPLLFGKSGQSPPAEIHPPTAFTLFGFHMTAAERYVPGKPGDPQRRRDGAPINDHYRYFDRTDTEHTIGFLTFTDPVSSPVLYAVNREGVGGCCYIMKGGQGGGEPNRFAGLNLRSNGSGILIGGVLAYRCENVKIEAKAGPAIGALHVIASYPLEIVSCRLSSQDCAFEGFSSLVQFTRVVVEGYGRHGVRMRGCSLSSDNLSVAPFQQKHTEAVFSFRPYPYGGTILLHGPTEVDSEGFGFRHGVIEAWQYPGMPVNMVVEDFNVAVVGQPGIPVPVIRLHTTGGKSEVGPALLTVNRIRSAECDAVVTVDGDGWVGSVFATQSRARVPVKRIDGGDPAEFFSVRTRP